MRKIMSTILISLIIIVVIGCSEKKTEQDYYTLANEQYGQELYADAIENFKIILEKYPDGETAAQSTFMVGFINANSLENLEEAKKYYTLFIEKYPTHDLADDAQYELDNLGQDINELPIFKDMQEKEQASTKE